ncbi:hypothetical protein THAOC_30613, partial [Thalassiosira oceanica]
HELACPAVQKLSGGDRKAGPKVTVSRPSGGFTYLYLLCLALILRLKLIVNPFSVWLGICLIPTETAKHRLSRIFCCKTKVLNEFLERSKTKNWSEDDDRDDVEFWEQQKQEYLKNNPSHAGMFTGDDEEAELDVGLKNDEGTAMLKFNPFTYKV